MKKIAIDARASPEKQSCENQLIELRAVAERSGYEIVSEYIDEGISGAKSRQDRSALNSMMNAATQRKFDLMFLQQGLDTSSASGRMMFSAFGALAEFERNLIRERVIAGKQRAKAAGVKLGRPSRMNDGMRNAIKILREKGVGIKQIAKQLGVGIGTVYSVI